jgi:hypothetical protein
MKRTVSAFAGGMITTILLGGPLMATAGTKIYTWVDANGNPTYSDQPPAQGVKFESKKIKTRNIADPLPGKNDETTDDSRLPQLVEETIPSERPMLKKNPQLCEQAKTNLETLKFARIRLPGEGYRYMTEEEKEAERANSREIMALHCEKDGG